MQQERFILRSGKESALMGERFKACRFLSFAASLENLPSHTLAATLDVSHMPKICRQ